MKTFFPILFSLFFIAGLYAQNTTQNTGKAKAEKLYREAKHDFARFEKQHSGFIQTSNVRMHYLSWGDSSGVPLIWAHGSLTNGYELFDIAERLVTAGYHVIAIDYYGHGQTAIPGHEVSLYHLADDINVLMDSLNIKKAVIGGWSRGGFAATAFYDAYPHRVLGLILEDGGSVSTNTYYHKMEQAALETRVKKIMQEMPLETVYETEFDAYKAIYDTATAGSQFTLLAWITKNKEGKWSICPGLIELFNMNNAANFLNNILRPTLAPLFAESMCILEPKIIYRNLKIPLLILDPVSDDDLFPFEKENAALQKQHPEFIIHKIYQQTGHNIHYERPEEFIRDVNDFLQRVKAGK